MKKFMLLITALLLFTFVSACNGADDDGSNTDEPQNGVSENGSEMPSDVLNDIDSGADAFLTDDVLALFALLALEMDAGGHTTTRDRMIELFGAPRMEDGSLLEFDVAEDFGIMALLNEDEVFVIFISPIPDLFIDESLEPDFELLNSYMEDSDGLTLDYFRELLGTPGFLQTYGEGIFSYTWRSSAFTLWVDVRSNNEVESVFFEEYFEVDFNQDFEQSFLVLPEDVMQAIDELVWEMQDNNGQVTEERAKEIIGLDYYVSEQFIIFPIVEGVEFFVIIGYDGMVEHANMSLDFIFYLNESLAIDIDDLNNLADNAEGMALDEFVDSIGSTGTFWQYTFNEFMYIWITPDITVIISVNQDNEIIEANVRHFVG